MKTPLKKGTPDDFQTPKYAIVPLLRYLKKGSCIWECASGKGNLVQAFLEKGFEVIGTDLLLGQDFLSCEPSQHYDYIVTNPPYSIKQEFLERAYSLQKPFAFLLPLTTFETQKRQRLFKQYGVEVIFFDKRINFETPSGNGGGSWFPVAWFTNGLNIGRQLTFESIEESRQVTFL